jgi:hypothetical protein
MPKGQRPSAHQAAKPHRYGLFLVKTAQLPGLGVVEDFIKRLRASSSDVRLSLDNQVIQAAGLNVIFDLASHASACISANHREVHAAPHA